MSTPSSFKICAEFPHGALPEVFGVLTVADPAEFRGEGGLPSSILGDALRIKKWQHYAAEVVLPGRAARCSDPDLSWPEATAFVG
jgi:hypothetical protein